MATRDQANERIYLYIDGVEATNKYEAARSLLNDGVLVVCAGVNFAGKFPGFQDQFIIFNRLLSPADVLNLYELGRII